MREFIDGAGAHIWLDLLDPRLDCDICLPRIHRHWLDAASRELAHADDYRDLCAGTLHTATYRRRWGNPCA